MKCGINGAEHDFNEIPCGINGAVRQASELWIGVNGAAKKVWPLIPIGYQVILDTVGEGTWVCPASGQWEVEGHGAGGHGGSSPYGGVAGAGGGGSGEIETITLVTGQVVSYLIGEGNTNRIKGGGTIFGGLNFPGGGSASGSSPGSASGSLATSGSRSQSLYGGAGGKGNINKPQQTYGDGGTGNSKYTSPSTPGAPGKDGAIILTYLG